MGLMFTKLGWGFDAWSNRLDGEQLEDADPFGAQTKAAAIAAAEDFREIVDVSSEAQREL